jgi:hypothetical protein
LILWISAFQVARVTGMSHQHLAGARYKREGGRSGSKRDDVMMETEIRVMSLEYKDEGRDHKPRNVGASGSWERGGRNNSLWSPQKNTATSTW